MQLQKISNKHTIVSRTPAGSLSIRYLNLEVFRYDAKTKQATVKATRDEQVLTRINQALAAGKFPQRVYATGGPKGEQSGLEVRLIDKTVKHEPFPSWNAEGGTAISSFFAEPILHDLERKAA